MSRTYELSYDGTQLYETLLLTPGHSSSPASIRYIFDQAANLARPRNPSSTPSIEPGIIRNSAGSVSLRTPGNPFSRVRRSALLN